MIKKIIGCLILVFSFIMASAQEQNISWKTYFESSVLEIGQNTNLILEVNVTGGWHIYGTEDQCDRINAYGPLLTELKLTETLGFESKGKLKAINPQKHMDEAFGCETTQFEGKGIYKMPVLITGEVLSAKGQLDGMICKDLVGCRPYEYGFIVTGESKKSSSKIDNNQNTKVENNSSTTTQPTATESKKIDLVAEKTTSEINTSNSKVDSLNALVQQLSSKNTNENTVTNANCDIERKAGWDDIEITRFEQQEKQTGWGDIIWLILGAFLAGLITVFTPCVFPMLPMTVTFFTKSNKSKGGAISQAMIYGLSIVLIYTAFGVIVGKTIGPQFANWIAVNWVVNLVFFLIFVVFALSFLGMFEITLPNSLVNKIDAKADKGGLVGTFFMALALVLVSFSCTGPIVGSIIVLAAQGEWIIPTLTMLAFSTAFALPFTVMAMFPSLMDKLPKSGGWLNSIKVVLGLLELALSLKFLSQIDQVEGLGILDREVFITIWIGVFITIALYLFGKIKFPHDSPLEKISVPRSILAIASLSFAIYLLPGLWGAPLKSLSGVFPPMHTQDFVLGVEKDNSDYLCEEPIHGDKLHVAHDIKAYFDIRQAICCAKEQKKPLFIDFTGHSCTNCRLMESKVWSDQRVLDALKKDFIVVSLYADEYKIDLPKEEQYTTKSGREIKVLGKAIQDFQEEKYGLAATLPTYSILEYDETNSTKDKIVLKELVETRAYDADVQGYLDFLNTGKAAFGTTAP